MNIFKVFLFFLLFSILLFFNCLLSSESNSITSKLNKCITCHTATGNSINPIWPKLAEQHSEYMLKQLFEFKKGKNGNRYDPTMFGMIQDVTDDEFFELSDYFSKQNLKKNDIKFDIKKFDDGKKIYLYGNSDKNIVACVGCHGFDGSGNKLAKFPNIKWQHKDYLVTQLKKFKMGERSNDINSIMRDITSEMTDDDINSVSIYISQMD